MSIIAVVSGYEACPVPVGAVKNVGALLNRVRSALTLTRPAGEYTYVLCGVDGEEADLGARQKAALEEVGIFGCEERVEVRVAYAGVAKEKLKEKAVVTAEDVAAEFTAALEERGDVGVTRVRQTVASKLLSDAAVNGLLAEALALAAWAGDTEALLWLTGLGCGDLNYLADSGHTPLVAAVHNNQPDAVALLLDKGADINMIAGNGTAALHFAVISGHEDIVRMLLGHSAAEVDVLDSAGHSPLTHAIRPGHLGMIATLCDSGADVNRVFEDSSCPLAFAVDSKQPAAMKALFARGAAVDTADSQGQTSLFRAVEDDAAEEATILLEAGANANVCDDNGNFPLLYAAGANNCEMVKLLLEHGADVELQSTEGPTLIFAAHHGHTATVALLLEFGARVDVVDEEGNGPVELAAQGNHHATVQVLLKHGADANRRGSCGHTPLIWAAQEGHTHTITALLEHGADPNLWDGCEPPMPPIAHAVYGNHKEAVAALLEGGAQLDVVVHDRPLLVTTAVRGLADMMATFIGFKADLDIQHADGPTALSAAVQQRHDDVANMLLTAGADPNLADGQGITPLWLAAAKPGMAHVVRHLIRLGADVNTKAGGVTPLEVAVHHGVEEVAEVLRELGGQ